MRAQKVRGGVLLFLPLPPSNNARMRPVIMGGRPRDILTTEARQYIDNVGTIVRPLAKTEAIKTLTTWEAVEFWVVTPRSNADAHNYEKVLWDMLQRSGVIEDDKYVLPRLMGFVWNPQAPQVIVRLPQ